MTKLESITDIRHTLFHLCVLQNRSKDPQASLQSFQIAADQLLDRFYEENTDLIAPKQYNAAKQDIAYFMRLVDLVFHYYSDSNNEDGSVKLHG